MAAQIEQGHKQVITVMYDMGINIYNGVFVLLVLTTNLVV